MTNSRTARLTVILAALMLGTVACGEASTPPPEPVSPAGSTSLSVEVLSPASVRISWAAVEGALEYTLEVRHGDADFLPIADLPADQLEFTHFVVPGAAQATYRLSATTGEGSREAGVQPVDLPVFVPDPLVVTSSAFAPQFSEVPVLPVLPTIDPSNPDPMAFATAMAALDSMNPDDFAVQMQATYPRTEIGPGGGEVTLTDPNGVIYTLSFPAGAVDQPTDITLIPIESVADLPCAAGPLAGVQIQPPIPFAGPLTLTISHPTASTLAGNTRVTAFTVSHLSNEFSLLPAFEVGQGKYALSVSWGDTFGLTAATAEEIVAQAARIPTDQGAQMAQQLAALRAADPEGGLEGDVRVAAYALQALVSQVGDLASDPATVRTAGLAAPAPGGGLRPPGANAASLLKSIFWAEAIWNFLNQMLPAGAPPPPGSELARSMDDWRTKIVSELTGSIKDYMDEHDGCRTGIALYAEALRQMLRKPGSAFQQALANEYRARYGPPPELQCEFRLQVVRSAFREFRPGDSYLGDNTETYAVHSEPWTLELAVREGRLLLRGPLSVIYDSWEVTHSACPPTMQLRPFPSSLVWITNLELIFDNDDRVTDLALKGVNVEQRGTNIDSQITTEEPQPGRCRVLSETSGVNPVDVWGIAFSGLHSEFLRMDDWVISGEDSFTATDTISGRVEGHYTEDTTLVLTVQQK